MSHEPKSPTIDFLRFRKMFADHVATLRIKDDAACSPAELARKRSWEALDFDPERILATPLQDLDRRVDLSQSESKVDFFIKPVKSDSQSVSRSSSPYSSGSSDRAMTSG